MPSAVHLVICISIRLSASRTLCARMYYLYLRFIGLKRYKFVSANLPRCRHEVNKFLKVYKYFNYGFPKYDFIHACTILRLHKKRDTSSMYLNRGANQIWTGDRGVADLCLTTWLWRHIKRRRRDLNPRAGFPTYTLSRGTSSASWVLLHRRQVPVNWYPVANPEQLLYPVNISYVTFDARFILLNSTCFVNEFFSIFCIFLPQLRIDYFPYNLLLQSPENPLP